ncbi:hypothetical protein X777_16321, partial [Ooceraea biroi]
LLVLRECRRNYRSAARMYHRFPDRQHHPNDRVFADIERRERQRPNVRRQRRRINVPERDDPRVLLVLAVVHLYPHFSL